MCPPPTKAIGEHILNFDAIALLKKPELLRSKLPPFAELIIGDVGDTVVELEHRIGDAKIAFVAVDLDYYSSTKRAMPLFTFENPKNTFPLCRFILMILSKLLH